MGVVWGRFMSPRIDLIELNKTSFIPGLPYLAKRHNHFYTGVQTLLWHHMRSTTISSLAFWFSKMTLIPPRRPFAGTSSNTIMCQCSVGHLNLRSKRLLCQFLDDIFLSFFLFPVCILVQKLPNTLHGSHPTWPLNWPPSPFNHRYSVPVHGHHADRHSTAGWHTAGIIIHSAFSTLCVHMHVVLFLTIM